MRFSLSTLTLFTLLVALSMALWFRREPWELVKTEEASEYNVRIGSAGTSPDQRREVVTQPLGWGASPTKIQIIDVQHSLDSNAGILWELYSPRFASAEGFRNDDVLILHVLKSDYQSWTRDTYHRRFPEWWWGHFYRPEVWASVLLFAILIARAVRSRKAKPAELIACVIPLQPY